MTVKPYRVLASGFDTIVLAIDVEWKNDSFFEYLDLLKAISIKDEKETAVAISNHETNENLWTGVVKPHGTKGYEWNLSSADFSILIGKWLKPKSRPSIMAQISSEAIWRSGPQNIVSFLLNLLKQAGAKILFAKASRIDLCIDILFPVKNWGMKLINHRVTRANYAAPHFFNDTMTGLSIGKGKISARLYDKPLEIKQQSNKLWMYDIWETQEVPSGFKIIRIEFQIRREVIKDLGLNSIDSVFDSSDNIWAYCSKQWLKFQTNPGKHHTQRKTYRWWKTIQNGFLGIQDAHPLVRCKAINPKIDQLSSQAYGSFKSFIALRAEELDLPMNYEATTRKAVKHISTFIKEQDKSDFKFSMDVHTKRAKYHRSSEKLIKANHKREELGFPVPLEDPLFMNKMRGK